MHAACSFGARMYSMRHGAQSGLPIPATLAAPAGLSKRLDVDLARDRGSARARGLLCAARAEEREIDGDSDPDADGRTDEIPREISDRGVAEPGRVEGLLG